MRPFFYGKTQKLRPLSRKLRHSAYPFVTILHRKSNVIIHKNHSIILRSGIHFATIIILKNTEHNVQLINF